jgi:hypothetical protein
VDEETNGSYPFANGLNGLNELAHLCPKHSVSFRHYVRLSEWTGNVLNREGAECSLVAGRGIGFVPQNKPLISNFSLILNVSVLWRKFTVFCSYYSEQKETNKLNAPAKFEDILLCKPSPRVTKVMTCHIVMFCHNHLCLSQDSLSPVGQDVTIFYFVGLS